MSYAESSEVRRPIGRLLEIVMYVAFMGTMAFLVCWILRPASPVVAKPNTVVARGSGDAELLRQYLAVEKGVPTVVEFMDFQCPPCRASWPKLKKTLQSFPGVKYRAVSFPLQMHPFAFGAAVAAEVARSAGQYESVFNDLFTGATDLDVKSLNDYLRKHDLDPCVGTPRSKVYREKVRRDMDIANKLQVNATPTMFLIGADGSLKQLTSYTQIETLLGSKH